HHRRQERPSRSARDCSLGRGEPERPHQRNACPRSTPPQASADRRRFRARARRHRRARDAEGSKGVAGLTLDSGALIAFERADRGVVAYLKEALRRGVDVPVPAIVVAEVWRGGRRAARIAALLPACIVEPLDEPLARLAGEALAAIKNSTVV